MAKVAEALGGWRAIPLMVVSALLVGFIVWRFPEQGPVLARKAGLATTGMWIGYIGYRILFRLIKDPDEDVRTLMMCKLGMIVAGMLCIALAV